MPCRSGCPVIVRGALYVDPDAVAAGRAAVAPRPWPRTDAGAASNAAIIAVRKTIPLKNRCRTCSTLRLLTLRCALGRSGKDISTVGERDRSRVHGRRSVPGAETIHLDGIA